MKKSIYTSYDELPLLLNVKQLADLMGVSDSSIYELIQEDDFPSLRIGKRIVVPKEELRKWIAAHTLCEERHHQKLFPRSQRSL